MTGGDRQVEVSVTGGDRQAEVYVTGGDRQVEVYVTLQHNIGAKSIVPSFCAPFFLSEG